MTGIKNKFEEIIWNGTYMREHWKNYFRDLNSNERDSKWNCAKKHVSAKKKKKRNKEVINFQK